MTRLTLALSAVILFSAAPLMAQQRTTLPPPIPAASAPSRVAASAPQPVGSVRANLGISPGEVAATPEMWFYQQQMQQYHDPKVAVRDKAELRVEQRQRRLASLKWFGFSNSRPVAGVDTLHGDYSPSWTANSSHYPFRWNGYGQPWVAALPAIPVSRAY